MADTFNSDLTGTDAPSAPGSFRGTGRPVTPQRESSTLDTVLGIGETIFKGGLEIVAQKRKRGLQAEVAESISSNLSQLRKLKAAGDQNINMSQEINVRLAAKAKELRVKGFDPEEINKAFRDEGFLPPKAALFNDLAAEELREEVAQANRMEEFLDAAVERNVQVKNPDGSMNRGATIAQAQLEATAQQSQAALFAELGLVVGTDGKISETARPEYFVKRVQIRKDVFTEVLIGMRGHINVLQDMLANATLKDLPAIEEQIQGITKIADQYRLQQVRNSVLLNKPEAADHMAFVDSVLLSITGGILDLEDIGDLNAMKATVAAVNWANQHTEFINFRDFSAISRFSKLNDRIGASFFNLALGQKGNRNKLQDVVTRELGVFTDQKPPVADFAPTTRAPKEAEVGELGADEAPYSEDERKRRIQFSIDIQREIRDQNLLVEGKADSFAWLKTHGPLFNARNKLSSADKKVLTEEYTSNSFIQNMEASLAIFPKKTAVVGAYAFDIVQEDLQNLGRELGNLSFSGRLDRDFEVVYDKVAKEFVVQDTQEFKDTALTVEMSLGTPKSGTFGNIPSIKERLEKINRDAKMLLKTRQFKDAFKEGSDIEFLEDTGALISGSGGDNELLGHGPIDLSELKPEISKALDVLNPLMEALGVPLVVTSTNKGTHMKGSKHFTNQAIDIRSRQLTLKKQRDLVKTLAEQLGQDYDVVLESDHIHIEFDPKENK